MPPQTNATVLRVAGAGRADDWDVPAAAGADKWAGQARAYLREATDRVVADGAVNVALRRELVLDTADVDVMGLDTDDTIEFRRDGGELELGKARAIRAARLAGVPSSLQTAKVTLEDV